MPQQITRCEKLVLCMMVKNEPRIQITFDSVAEHIGHFIIFDTGSTDDTVSRIQTYCKEKGIKLDLKQGSFVNFCISRNDLLNYADEVLKSKDHYLLLLDANDEMKEMSHLVKFANTHTGPQHGVYMIQRWWSGHALDSYYNVRLIKSGHGWRYKGVVHEYIMCPAIEIEHKSNDEVIHRLEDVFIYQDRTADDDKSFRRFSRDKDMLYAEWLRDPREPRTLFYLAQTYGCLGETREAFKFYLLRIKEIGFWEEIYQSLYRLGELAQTLGHEWEESMLWYLRAFQHSQRAEPLVKIAEYYREHNFLRENKPEWHTCYMYANMACQLTFPWNNILFVNKRVYTYTRWHLLGIAAFYVGRYKEGKEACLRALEAENKELDRNNLRFYLEKELEFRSGGSVNAPALLAVSFGDQEVRHKDELEIKHDRSALLRTAMDVIISERAAAGRPIDPTILTDWKIPFRTNPSTSGSTIVTGSPVPAPAPVVMPTLNRRDRRAQQKVLRLTSKTAARLARAPRARPGQNSGSSIIPSGSVLGPSPSLPKG